MWGGHHAQGALPWCHECCQMQSSSELQGKDLGMSSADLDKSPLQK